MYIMATSKEVSTISDIIRMPKVSEDAERIEHFNQKYTAPKFLAEVETPKIKEEVKVEKAFELEIPGEETIAEKKIRAYAKQKAQVFLSLKAKLVISVYAVVMVLLGTLLIYNFASINSYTHQINTNTEILATESAYLEEVIDSLNLSKKQADTIKNNMKLISEEQLINLKLSTKGEIAGFTKDTNWFDAICNFLSEIFGG